MRHTHRPGAALWAKTKVAARRMRRQPTEPERLLWEQLRDRRFHGKKFRRQHPIGRFVVDFCCPEHSLVIELDGAIHDRTVDEDRWRTAELQRLGFSVLRIHNDEVRQKMPATLEHIGRTLQRQDASGDQRTSACSPSPCNGEGAGG